MNDGWLKLHRKIKNTELWMEKRKFSKFEAWIDILLSANYEDSYILDGYKKILIKKGSFITSKSKLAKKWGISRTTLNKYFDLFIDQKMISTKCTTKYTIVTIENWDLYQITEQQSRHKSDSELDSTFLKNSTQSCTAEHTSQTTTALSIEGITEQQDRHKSNSELDNNLDTKKEYIRSLYYLLLNKYKENPPKNFWDRLHKISEIKKTKEYQLLDVDTQRDLFIKLQTMKITRY